MNNFVFIIPSYNNIEWCEKNLTSIFRQTRNNWRVLYVDDGSDDGTPDLAEKLAGEHGAKSRFQIITSVKNQGPAASRYMGYQNAEDDEICCMLDGDDWLLNDSVLELLEVFYKQGFNATCGSYFVYEDAKFWRRGKQEIMLPRIIPAGRDNWRCQHLRTMKARLIKDIPLEHLQINGEWIRCCSDMAEGIHVHENKDARIASVLSPVYVYNRENSRRYKLSYCRPELSEYKEAVRRHVAQFKKP